MQENAQRKKLSRLIRLTPACQVFCVQQVGESDFVVSLHNVVQNRLSQHGMPWQECVAWGGRLCHRGVRARISDQAAARDEWGPNI